MKCRRFIFATIAGIGAGFCFVAGQSLDVHYTLTLTQKDFYVKWLIAAVILGLLIHVSWEIAVRGVKVPEICRKIIPKVASLERKLSFPILILLFLLMWLPAWLSIFPGVFSYDAYDEWRQICTGEITAHHPVLHVLFLGGIVEGVYQLTGSYNAGIALSTFLQMLILAATFAYTIQFFRERGISSVLSLFAIVFYGLSPVVQLFAICGTKDTLFTAAFVLFMISIYRTVMEKELFFQKRGWMFLMVGSAVATMILRNNGLYIVVIMLIILGFLCRAYIKKYLVLFGTIVLLYTMYVGPFYSMLGVTAGGVQEMLSVPLQQLARVYAYEKDTFTQEELEYLHEIVPEKNWKMYRSTVSDFVKSGFQQVVFEEEPAKFVRLWAKIGLKHPLTYINSFLLGTVDFWYPFAVVDGYQDVYGKSSFFDYKVSEPGTEQVLLPGLHEMYESISHEKEVQKLPGMFLILSPGWYLLLYLSLFLYLWREKQYGLLVPLVAILLNFATVLLGPIALVRYVLILYFAFPMYCILLPDKTKR